MALTCGAVVGVALRWSGELGRTSAWDHPRRAVGNEPVEHGEDVLVEARPGAIDARSPVELASPEALAATWLPVPANRLVAGMSGEAIMELFWGERWPEERAFLEKYGGLEYVNDFHAGDDCMLGDVRAVLDPEYLQRRFQRHFDGLGGARFIAGRGSFDPFEPDKVLRRLEREVQSASGAGAVLDWSQGQAVGIRNALLSDLARLSDHYEELESRVGSLILSVMAGVTTSTPPSIGSMHVSPIVRVGTKGGVLDLADPTRARWQIPFVGGSPEGNSILGVNYTLCLVDDEQAAQVIAAILSLEAQLASSMQVWAAELALGASK